MTYIGRVMFDDGPHKYVVLDQVGDTACEADGAWEALQQFAAPGQTGTVTNGQISNLPFFGPVQDIVDQANHSVTNVAQPGHLFYPGSATREVVVANGKVYIQTTGVGSGQFAGINVLLCGRNSTIRSRSTLTQTTTVLATARESAHVSFGNHRGRINHGHYGYGSQLLRP